MEIGTEMPFISKLMPPAPEDVFPECRNVLSVDDVPATWLADDWKGLESRMLSAKLLLKELLIKWEAADCCPCATDWLKCNGWCRWPAAALGNVEWLLVETGLPTARSRNGDLVPPNEDCVEDEEPFE